MSETVQKYQNIFDSLAPMLLSISPDEGFGTTEDIEKTITDLRKNFETDFNGVDKVRDLLFGEHIDSYGDKVTGYFKDCNDMAEGPKLTSLVAIAIEEFEINMDTPLGLGIFASAILAEIPNEMSYHGNPHYRKVLFHSIRLISRNNQIQKDNPDLKLTHDNIAALLMASCIHDLGHQGGDNLKDGFYTPGAMEQYSFELAAPYYTELGITKEQRDEIETLVFCTDITFFAGDNSPCVRMKQIYKHFIWQDDKKDVSMMMIGKLRLFEDNPRLVLMAMILHEADVGSSAGLSYEQTIIETISFMDERGMRTAGPNIVLAFLRDQLGETMFTDAARQIFGPAMTDVIKKAENDIKNGRENFYDT